MRKWRLKARNRRIPADLPAVICKRGHETLADGNVTTNFCPVCGAAIVSSRAPSFRSRREGK